MFVHLCFGEPKTIFHSGGQWCRFLFYFSLIYSINCFTKETVKEKWLHVTDSAPLEGCTSWDRHSLRKEGWALIYQQVDLCEVGLPGLPVNLKLLIVSGKQVGWHDSLNKSSLLVKPSPHLNTCWGHTVPPLLLLIQPAWNDSFTMTWLFCQGSICLQIDRNYSRQYH